MPTVHVQTNIESTEYVKFKRKMEELNVTEYELLRSMVIFCLNDKNAPEWLRLMRALKEFFKYDLKQTGRL